MGLSTAEPIHEFVSAEKGHHSAHKTVNPRRTVYRSRRLSVALDRPPGVPTLTDFGLAVQDAHAPHAGLIQPLLFRAPEVILKMPWDGRADIWNLGVLVSLAVVRGEGCGVGGGSMGGKGLIMDRYGNLCLTSKIGRAHV